MTSAPSATRSPRMLPHAAGSARVAAIRRTYPWLVTPISHGEISELAVASAAQQAGAAWLARSREVDGRQRADGRADGDPVGRVLGVSGGCPPALNVAPMTHGLVLAPGAQPWAEGIGTHAPARSRRCGSERGAAADSRRRRKGSGARTGIRVALAPHRDRPPVPAGPVPGAQGRA